MTQVDLKLWGDPLTPFGFMLLPLHLCQLCPCNAVTGKGEQLAVLTEPFLLHSLFSVRSWSFPTAHGQEAVGASSCEWEGKKEKVPTFDCSGVSERLLQPVACSLGACAEFEQLKKSPFSFSENKVVESMQTLQNVAASQSDIIFFGIDRYISILKKCC